MTKLEQLRAVYKTHARVTTSSARVLALLDLWAACEAERDAACPYADREGDEYAGPNRGDSYCDRDSHTDECPVTIARAAVAAVLKKGLP